MKILIENEGESITVEELEEDIRFQVEDESQFSITKEDFERIYYAMVLPDKET